MYVCSNNIIIMSYRCPTAAKNRIMEVTQRSPGLRLHCLVGGPPTLAAGWRHVIVLHRLLPWLGCQCQQKVQGIATHGTSRLYNHRNKVVHPGHVKVLCFLSLFCQCCHSPCLPRGLGQVRHSKGICACGIPNKGASWLPGDDCNPIGSLAVCLAKPCRLQHWGDLCRRQGSLNDVVKSDLRFCSSWGRGWPICPPRYHNGSMYMGSTVEYPGGAQQL